MRLTGNGRQSQDPNRCPDTAAHEREHWDGAGGRNWTRTLTGKVRVTCSGIDVTEVVSPPDLLILGS